MSKIFAMNIVMFVDVISNFLILFLGTLEGKLKFLHPESTDRKTIESELLEIKKLVETHQVGLKSLRQKNRKSFMFVAGLIFFIFLSYSVYVLVFGI